MSKRIIVCCDGTWNTPDQKRNGVSTSTNVVKTADAIADRDALGGEQRVFYHRGIGTRKWERFTGGVFGVGLSRDVQDAYRFLVSVYEPGDELFFFGFSRGAYTARSTVGLIHNSGLLRREHADRVGAAYALYRSRAQNTAPPEAEARLFRRTYSHEPKIRFVGVWDTVGAYGIPITGIPLVQLVNKRWQFHDAELSPAVAAAFQALAIDERRRPFVPAIWKPCADAPEQLVEQVWFTGVHSDAGGGYPEHGLSDVTLLWMARRAESCGLAFTPDAFGPGAIHPVTPDAHATPHDSLSTGYRLLGPKARTLGHDDAAHEFAASSAIEKFKKGDGYEPANLAQYLAGPHQQMQVP